MKSMKYALTLFCLLFSLQSFALIDLRLGYGFNDFSEDGIEGAAMETVNGLSVDALVGFPLFPLGVGIRYENLQNSDGVDSELERIAVLGNLRFIDTLLYLGGIASVGLTNSYEIGTLKFDSGLTYSVAAEGGVRLGLFSIGAELGYLLGTLEGPLGLEAKMNSTYFKALVGVGF